MNAINKIFAPQARVPATPVKPKIPAITANTKNVTAQLSIVYPPELRL
jgi:hypothetical protein